MNKKELIKHLRSYSDDEVFAAHLWSTDDIITHAKGNNIKINKKEAGQILENIQRHLDSEYGITWVTISDAIVDFDNERKTN